MGAAEGRQEVSGVGAGEELLHRTVEELRVSAGLMGQCAAHGLLHEDVGALSLGIGCAADEGVGCGRESEVEEDLPAGIWVVGDDHVDGQQPVELAAQSVPRSDGGPGADYCHQTGGVAVGFEGKRFWAWWSSAAVSGLVRVTP
ncbi:hypothetical protein [Streptomyces sp. NPDC005167]